MNLLHLRCRVLILAAIVCLTCGLFAVAADEPTLTKEQIKQFLVTAKVVKSREAAKGITHTQRLTLSDGTVTHDASFQDMDEHKAVKQLGMGDMLPVYVERKWGGNTGSLSWWLSVKMDEAERHKQKLTAPDADAWNNQMYKIRVFDQLVSDSDPNLTNVVIGENWQIWRIDFTRAFRLNKELKSPADLVRCDRQLLEKLKALDANELTEKTKKYLAKDEVKAVMARRDRIVAQFQKMIAEKGENEVLY